MDFRSISEMLPQQRADELLPLGLMHPLGVRGYDRLAEVEDAREALLPRLEESFRRPDSTYAFRNGDTREWRVSGANVLQVEAGQVTYQDVTGASPGLPQTEPWTLAWRTGLAEWTADVQQLGGAWVRRSGVQGESWESLRDIEALQDIDLQVWLPHWPAWRYLPRRVAPAAEGPTLHPRPTGASVFKDERFQETRGPCSAYKGGLGAAFPKYKAALAGLEVHIVDRGDVRHYIRIWGQDEYDGKSNLLPQASVVVVRGAEAALKAFYEWMRYVELAVYPVLHDVEWAREHDADAEYKPEACGHPSLLMSPAAGVAVAVVFADDLLAVRAALVAELGCACTEGAGPEWVPALTAPYDHVLALAAGWAVTDPRVGWQAWVARRPFKWHFYILWEQAQWGRALSADRRLAAGYTDLCSTGVAWGSRDYDTDFLGRIPVSRARWREKGFTTFFAHYETALTVQTVEQIFGDTDGAVVRLVGGGGSPASVLGQECFGVFCDETALFYFDAAERVLSRDFTETISLRSILKGFSPYGNSGGDERTAWRKCLMAHLPLNTQVLRDPVETFVRFFTDDVRWGLEGELLVGGVTIARLGGDGVVDLGDGWLVHPGIFPFQGFNHGFRDVHGRVFKGTVSELHGRIIAIPNVRLVTAPESLARQIAAAKSARVAWIDVLWAIQQRVSETVQFGQLQFYLRHDVSDGVADLHTSGWELCLFPEDGSIVRLFAWVSYVKEWYSAGNYPIPKECSPVDEALNRIVAAQNNPKTMI